MLDQDRLYFTVDGRDVQYVIALDKATGRTLWKTDRLIDYTPFPINCRKAFCTPVLIEAAGRQQLFSPGAFTDVGSMSQYLQQIAHRIHQNVTFAPVHFLGTVEAMFTTRFRRFHALAVDNRQTGLRLAARFAPNPLT